MTSLRAALMSCITECLEEGRPEVDQIITKARTKYRKLFAEESDRLVWQASRRVVKELLRGMGETEEQVALPGLGLPAAIAVRREDTSIYYVRSDKATWAELCSGRAEREQHVNASQARLDQYDVAMDRLRPIMENDLTMTVEQAVNKLAQEKTAA